MPRPLVISTSGLSAGLRRKVIDAGRQRLDPLQTRRAAEHVVAQLDAEHDDDVDVGKVAFHLVGVTEQRKLQLRKFGLQRVAVHVRVNVDDESLGHAGGKPK